MKYSIFILFQLAISIMIFGQDRAYFIPFKQGNLWSVVDKNDKLLFEPKYEETFPSTFNLIKVRQGSKFGFINPEGNVIIEPIYDKATDYYNFGLELYSYVTLKDSSFYIDLKGKKMTPSFGAFGGVFSNMPNGLSVFKENGNYGLLSMGGDTLAKPMFVQIINYDDGNFVIAQNAEMKFGLLDWRGDTIYPFTLDSVKHRYNRRNTFYRIYKGKLNGIINLGGQIIADPVYESLKLYPHFNRGLCFKAKKNESILGYVYKRKEYWKEE